MDEDLVKKQLDLLWDKVQQSAARDIHGNGSQNFPEHDLASVFELAQFEIQSESLNLLKARFAKEKTYWCPNQNRKTANIKKETDGGKSLKLFFRKTLEVPSNTQVRIAKITPTFKIIAEKLKSVDK